MSLINFAERKSFGRPLVSELRGVENIMGVVAHCTWCSKKASCQVHWNFKVWLAKNELGGKGAI